jgi:hypothetical protein
MKARIFCLSTVLALLLPASNRVFAHHSFGAEYLSSLDTWTGTVTMIMFRTPHVHLFMDVQDKDKTVTNWTFELTTPEQVLRRGLTRQSIKVGDKLKVVGYPGRDNQTIAMIQTISSPEGQLLYVWDYEDFGQTKSDGIVVTPTGERNQRP